MTLIVQDRETFNFSTPGFAGGFATLPVDVSLIGDSGSLPEANIFAETRGEPGQGLNLFAPISPTLPFNFFNNNSTPINDAKIDTLNVPTFTKGIEPIIQQKSPREIIDSGNLLEMQRLRDSKAGVLLSAANPKEFERLNKAIVAASLKQVADKGTALLNPQIAVNQNHPTNANVLSQLPGAISVQAGETLKTVGSTVGKTAGFITTEIVANNLPLLLLAGLVGYFVIKMR